MADPPVVHTLHEPLLASMVSFLLHNKPLLDALSAAKTHDLRFLTGACQLSNLKDSYAQTC